MAKRKESIEADEDVDQHFLDQVLNQLYDFGDGSKHRKHKKSKKKNTHAEEEGEPETNDSFTNTGINFEDSDGDLFATEAARVGIAPTASCHSNVPVVVFEDPLKKRKTNPPITSETAEGKPPETKKRKTEDEAEFSIEKARLEVHRFGITGYKKDQQRVIEQDRAIMLGAMPPKREYVNYKQYQQMIKDKKRMEAEDVKTDKGKKRGKEGKSRDKKQKSVSSGAPSGQVGRFKGGVLVLNSKELQAMKGKIKRSK